MGVDENKRQDMLMQLLARGVPWALAVEAIASTALSHEVPDA